MTTPGYSGAPGDPPSPARLDLTNGALTFFPEGRLEGPDEFALPTSQLHSVEVVPATNLSPTMVRGLTVGGEVLQWQVAPDNEGMADGFVRLLKAATDAPSAPDSEPNIPALVPLDREVSSLDVQGLRKVWQAFVAKQGGGMMVETTLKVERGCQNLWPATYSPMNPEGTPPDLCGERLCGDCLCGDLKAAVLAGLAEDHLDVLHVRVGYLGVGVWYGPRLRDDMTLHEHGVYKCPVVIRLRWTGTLTIPLDVRVQGRTATGRLVTTSHPVVYELHSDMTKVEAKAALREALEENVIICLSCNEDKVIGTDPGGGEWLCIPTGHDTVEILRLSIAEALKCDAGLVRLLQEGGPVSGDSRIKDYSAIIVKFANGIANSSLGRVPLPYSLTKSPTEVLEQIMEDYFKVCWDDECDSGDCAGERCFRTSQDVHVCPPDIIAGLPVLNFIFVKTPDGKTITLKDVPCMSTVQELKERIQELLKIPPDAQRLIFDEKQLDPARSIEDYNLHNESTLRLALIFRSGW